MGTHSTTIMADFFARGVSDSASGGKFWQVEVDGGTMKTTYGKLGDGGATSVKEFGDTDKAMKEAQKLVKQKEKKGYVMEEDAEAPAKKGAKKSEMKKTIAKKPPAKKAAPKAKKAASKSGGYMKRGVSDSSSGGKFWQ